MDKGNCGNLNKSLNVAPQNIHLNKTIYFLNISKIIDILFIIFRQYNIMFLSSEANEVYCLELEVPADICFEFDCRYYRCCPVINENFRY